MSLEDSLKGKINKKIFCPSFTAAKIKTLLTTGVYGVCVYVERAACYEIAERIQIVGLMQHD